MERIDNKTVIYNQIETLFNEYFENRNISIDGLDYKSVPMNTFQDAFIYIHDNYISHNISNNDYRNMNQDIINKLNAYTDIFIRLVYRYNIQSFQKHYCYYLGISRDTLYSWSKEENNHRGFGDELSYIAKKIQELPKDTARNRIADIPNGELMLANNDVEVGLEYNGKRQLEQEAARQLTTTADLRSLLNCTKS